MPFKIYRELTQCQYCYKSKGPKVSLQNVQGARSIYIRVHSLPDEHIDASKTLRDFTSKHRPTINETAVRALYVFEDPSRAGRDLLMLRLRPSSNAFPMAEDMRGQLKQIKEDDKRVGTLGALLVVCEVIDTKSTNVVLVPIPMGLPPSLSQPDIPWEDMPNNGHVV
ncbi:hypothetical protein B0H14DRAFT_3136477 [Mycena olivaceomarginata]|nr:hypothetical protein B0H14DRAFT_3136477 [Mycena olivaceomarginata]